MVFRDGASSQAVWASWRESVVPTRGPLRFALGQPENLRSSSKFLRAWKFAWFSERARRPFLPVRSERRRVPANLRHDKNRILDLSLWRVPGRSQQLQNLPVRSPPARADRTDQANRCGTKSPCRNIGAAKRTSLLLNTGR